ncbi:hypothetical protein CYMTET_40905, partial [Cymbomonas tetramitiformis]
AVGVDGEFFDCTLPSPHPKRFLVDSGSTPRSPPKPGIDDDDHDDDFVDAPTAMPAESPSPPLLSPEEKGRGAPTPGGTSSSSGKREPWATASTRYPTAPAKPPVPARSKTPTAVSRSALPKTARSTAAPSVVPRGAAPSDPPSAATSRSASARRTGGTSGSAKESSAPATGRADTGRSRSPSASRIPSFKKGAGAGAGTATGILTAAQTIAASSGNFYSDGASHSSEESGSEDVEDPTFCVGHAGDVNYFNLADDGELYGACEWHVYMRRELQAIEMERYVLQCADDVITWRDATLGFLEFYASVVRGIDG